jgi:hypothetical protein
MKRPAFQFYPGDWRKDVELRSCSIAARGLWIDLMCVMHDCDPYGHLVLNGRPMTTPQIAGQIGLPMTQLSKLLDELLGNGVARKNEEGVIFSKRMVEDERVRTARAEGGKAGSEHGSKGASFGSKGGRPKASKGGFETPLETPLRLDEEPPPSSSSSSSPSGNASEANASAAAGGEGELTKAELWSAGKSLLEAQGMPKAQCGSFVGKLVKDYGDAIVVEAVRTTVVERPADAAQFLVGVCKNAAGKRSVGKANGKHAGFENMDYHQGVDADGSLV